MSIQPPRSAAASATESRERADRPLLGKTVLVIGGAKNLGGHVSRDLAIQGARVAVHYNSDATAAAAEETVAAVNDADSEAFAIQADLTDVAQVERTFDAVMDRYGSLYATVNTAGVAVGRPVVEFSEADYDAMMGVNAKAAFFVMREAAKRTEDGGRIITLVTSLLAAFTFSWDAAHPGEYEFVTSQAMGNQLTQVEDIVPWVRFLLTEGWWLNGQTVLVNGGFTTR